MTAVRKTGLPATADDRTRVLILGSLPGDKSLERKEYYAGRGNQFWRLIGPVIGSEMHGLPYAERVERLLAAGVGLWDVISSARRPGSLDSAISDAVDNDLAGFAARLPRLRAIGFQGRKAARIGRRRIGPAPVELVDLPSCSAAYCRMPFDAKQAQWLALRDHLGSNAA